jgi:peroxiredoxin
MASPAEDTNNDRRRLGRRALIAMAMLSIATPTAGLFAIPDGHGEVRRPGSESPVRAAGRAEIGDRAPDFSLPTLEELGERLSDYRGRSVVVTFFASWCHPCEQEMPLLEAASRRAGDALQVLAVSYEDRPEASGAFLEELGVTFPGLVDHDGSVARTYGVRAIPQTFFIDTNGVVRDRLFGITTPDGLRRPLDALLHARA